MISTVSLLRLDGKWLTIRSQQEANGVKVISGFEASLEVAKIKALEIVQKEKLVYGGEVLPNKPVLVVYPGKNEAGELYSCGPEHKELIRIFYSVAEAHRQGSDFANKHGFDCLSLS